MLVPMPRRGFPRVQRFVLFLGNHSGSSEADPYLFRREDHSAADRTSVQKWRAVHALLRLGHDPHIWLQRLPALGIAPLRLLLGDRTRDDHVLAWFPIDRRSHLVPGGYLQRIDHPQHFVEVTARRHRINKDELDLFVRTDDVNVAYGSVVGRRALFRVAPGLGWEHPIQLRNLEISVADNWIIRRIALRFLDVLSPSLMIASRIDRQSDDLHVSAVELWLNLGYIAEFGRADRGEVFRV